jgi:hypothetical protein
VSSKFRWADFLKESGPEPPSSIANAYWMCIGTLLPSRGPPNVVTYREICLSPGQLILEALMSTDADTTMIDEQVAAIADRKTE